jgi:protein-disulfide isomerase
MTTQRTTPRTTAATTTRRSSAVARAIGLACLATLAIASCYRTAHDPALDQRLDKIEQRLDVQDKAIADASSRSDIIELSLLAGKIDELQQQIAELTSRVKTAQVAAPTVPAMRRGPDRTAVYAVPIGASPVAGSPKARVTMVMAFEFACPYCRKAFDTVDDLRQQYGSDLRVVYKQYVVHPQTAGLMANALCAAHRQSRWRELADLLWVRAFDAHNYAAANIDAIATAAGLDMRRYQADLAGTCPQEIKDEMTALTKIGVNATPSFFINGRFIAGAQPITSFSALIDEELAKAKAAEKRGVKPERYYDQEVLAKGLTELAP